MRALGPHPFELANRNGAVLRRAPILTVSFEEGECAPPARDLLPHPLAVDEHQGGVAGQCGVQLLARGHESM